MKNGEVKNSLAPAGCYHPADDNIHLRAIEIVLQMATKIVEAEIFLLKEI